jgi:hypothetical protein
LLVAMGPLGNANALGSAQVSDSASGDTAIVAGQAGKSIYVVAYSLVANGTVQATWKSSGGTALEGPLYLAANSGSAPSVPPPGYLFKTVTGEGLTLNLSAAIAVGGRVTYFVQ